MSDPAPSMRLVGTEPAPAAVGKWIDLETAARRSSKSLGHLSRRCRDEWRAAGTAKLDQPAEGGKSCWYVREDADPSFALVKFPEQLAFDIRTLSETHRALLLDRKRILDNWQTARAGGIKLGFQEAQITEQFIQHLDLAEGKTLSRKTLFNWQSAFRAEGLGGLVDKRWIKVGEAIDGDPFFECLQNYYLTPRRPSKRSCYDATCFKAEEQGWTIKGYRTACLYLEQIPAAVARKLREGDDAYIAKNEPSIERDYTTLHTNEIWVGDHHQFDVMVLDEDGKLCRPWLTAWMDCRSRKIVGHCIASHSPNQNSILSALRGAILSSGLPDMLYVDNGKDFDCYIFHGRTKKERQQQSRQRIKIELNTGHIKGILNHLSVKAQFAWVEHGQSKTVEPWFGRMEDRFGRNWPTYIGNKPATRPEDAWDKIDRGESPRLADFSTSFTQWLEVDYHARPHTGDGMSLAGVDLTPAQAFDSFWNDHSKRTTTSGMIDLLLMKSPKPVKVGKNGVTWNGLRYGQYAAELFTLQGKEVYLRIDERDINVIQIWSLDDKFICLAPANAKIPFNASEEQLREAIRAKGQHRKLAREYHQRRTRMTEDLPDLMTRAAAARHAKHAAENPVAPNDPPSIKPHRSPLEEQLIAVQNAAERRQAGKIAVGAESLPSRFFYQSSEPAEEQESEPSFRMSLAPMEDVP